MSNETASGDASTQHSADVRRDSVDFPEPQRAFAFRLSEALPADDILSVWVATISIAVNDLSIVYKRLKEDPDETLVYWIRLAVSHFAEAAPYLSDSMTVSEIADFIAVLSPDVRDQADTCLRIYAEHQSVIEQIRNKAGFHYPELKERGWKRSPVNRALGELADNPSLIKTDRVRDGRFVFGHDVAARIFEDVSGVDVKVVHTDVNAGITAFVLFGNAAIAAHFRNKKKAGLEIWGVEDRGDGTWEAVG